MNAGLELGGLSLSPVPMEAHRQLVLAETSTRSNPLLVVRSGFFFDKQVKSLPALQFPVTNLRAMIAFMAQPYI